MERRSGKIGWRVALTGTLLAGSIFVCAGAFSQEPDAETYQWKRVAIGGGGFITGLDMDLSGRTRVARTDVHGAYLWLEDQDRWAQLATVAAMPKADRVQAGFGEGAFEIVVAPSDPARIYMAAGGTVYRSRDRGLSFEDMGAAAPFPFVFDANSPYRTYGPFLSVSPSEPDLVLFGTPAAGLWRSADGGESWQAARGLPAATGQPAPGILSWFERASGRIWAASPGNGVFVSTDGGTSFSPLTPAGEPAPALLTQGVFARDGSFFGVEGQARRAWVYRDGRWSDLTASGALPALPYAAVAASPGSDTIFVFDQGGTVYRSTDGGAAWGRMGHTAAPSDGDPPWLRIADQSYFATGPVRFDPVTPDRIWVGAGTGVYFADVPPSARVVRWQSLTRGIEELVATDVVQSPGRPPLFAFLDFGIHRKEDLDAFSTGYGPKERVLIAAQQLAVTPADPDFIATNASDTRTGCCSEDGDSVLAGYSPDAGRSWRRFPSLPTPPGTEPVDPWRMSFGALAVSAGDPRNIVWEPSFDRAPFVTTDRGGSWTRVAFAGETLPFTGSHPTIYLIRKNLAADGARSGVFYLAHSGGGGNAALAGLWRTEDKGASWRQVHRGEVAPNSGSAAKLRAVPGRAGDLFFTSASGGPDTLARRSRDGGETWAPLPGVEDVDDFAFGKPAAAGAAPTIFLSGRVGGDYGIWRSVDDAESWQRIGSFPMGSLDRVTVMGADPDHFGRVYVGYMGSAFVYGEPSACAPGPFVAFAASECSAVR